MCLERVKKSWTIKITNLEAKGASAVEYYHNVPSRNSSIRFRRILRVYVLYVSRNCRFSKPLDSLGKYTNIGKVGNQFSMW